MLWGKERESNPNPNPEMPGTILTYEQGKAGFVQCRAVGGLPPPTLRLIDTSTDRAFELTTNNTLSNMSGEKGMRKVSG